MRREIYNLKDNCVNVSLTEDIDTSTFSCGNKDIDDYFHYEALFYEKEMLSRNYAFLTETGADIVSAFSLCNSSIDMRYLPSPTKNRLQRKIPNLKRRRSYPALLIGRLGVNEKFAGLGVGSQVIDYIKCMCISSTNRGICRYIVVDAVNNLKIIQFYIKNGFTMLFGSEDDERTGSGIPHDATLKTRKIYCDLRLWLSSHGL